ncbi:MAG: biosynthetic-type acetolactate synthase large subunit [Spirochaetes bacterium]|nr:biosynthetic-type acetolactate synthase large subunit [Spirochaetota bacterium]
MNGAELTIRLLEREGISVIAGIPGGTNLPLYDALYASSIRHILVRHEQAAGFLAQGMSRSTGKTAVCFATSGPGATNLITALADAKMDSVPIVAITGQVSTALIGTDAFQEIDIYGMTIPITKHNFLVRSASELLEVIPEAFRIAASGRQGPVLVDIPKDVQLSPVSVDAFPERSAIDAKPAPDEQSLRTIASMITAAKRPLLYIGGGCIHNGASELIRELAHRNGIPAVHTLMGAGVFPSGDALDLGMLGMHGKSATNHLSKETDLLIVLGARFDDRATGRSDAFCPDASVIHVDIDDAEIGKIRATDMHIVADVSQTLKLLLPHITENKRSAWRARIAELKSMHPPLTVSDTHPAHVVAAAQSYFGDNVIVTTDVGQHQMWTAQTWNCVRPRQLLTSGGLGTMGFGLPAAIGASLVNPDTPVCCMSGDGSILMNIQELATLAELNLPVTIILFNNGHLGLVRQQQELFFGKRYIASRFQKNPDFVTIARGFGITAMRATPETIADVLRSNSAGKAPLFIDVAIPADANVYPIVPPGKANHEMIGAEL